MCDDVNSTRLGYYVKLIIYFFCCRDFQGIIFCVGWMFDASYLQLKRVEMRCMNGFQFWFPRANDDGWFDIYFAPFRCAFNSHLRWFLAHPAVSALMWFNVDSCHRNSTIDSLDMQDAFGLLLLIAASFICLKRILRCFSFFCSGWVSAREARRGNEFPLSDSWMRNRNLFPSSIDVASQFTSDLYLNVSRFNPFNYWFPQNLFHTFRTFTEF